MKVHPTALVEAGASLGEGVEIGAFSLIGARAVIGHESKIQSHVIIEGDVRIGQRNVVSHGSVIGGPPQDLGFAASTESRVEIGDDNVIREHCTIHRGTTEGSATTIGNANFLMAGVHVGHNCRIGKEIIIANNCLLGGYVQIDDRVFLGGGTVFHQFMHVGRLVMTQGRSGFSKDIPPFVLAADKNCVYGVNVVGLRRAGFSASERQEIKRAFKLLYRSGLNLKQALEKAADSDFGTSGREFFDFVANAGTRGILSYRHTNGAEE